MYTISVINNNTNIAYKVDTMAESNTMVHTLITLAVAKNKDREIVLENDTHVLERWTVRDGNVDYG
jgi:hypothetical protein